MDYFHAEMTPSPTPEDQLLGTPMTNPSTPNTKKTLQKPISTKVTKKKKSGNTTVNPSPNRVSKTSPMPKSKSEIQAYDQIILDGRAANPPVPWKELEDMFKAAGGITTGHILLRTTRYPALKAISEEMTPQEIGKLVVAEAAVDAEYQKQKWGLVAAHLKAGEGGKEWNAKFLKKTFTGLSRSGV